MKKTLLILAAVVLVLVTILLVIRLKSPEDTWLCQNGQWVRHGNPASDPVGVCGNPIVVPSNANLKDLNIKANQEVKSPLVLTGQARGVWYFEASFPVELKDADGNLLASGIATAQGEWMTENFVPFTTVLNFTINQTMPAKLILKKDNPSGLPENDDQLEIPLTLLP